ncbi:hypothetical protein THRCLA_23033 [Thraustotheca clavata]|uniref:Uncharacterized protein n=1 Tax=Thraustotheca clavata TaxID=74557 RepID=A0A1V9YI28_9STRA|nr:hypothetical protein THRCLA_23033 [Thraustotheca clavata]
MPIIYEVTNYCDPNAVKTLLEYMTNGHLQDMINTGCFTLAEFEQCSPTQFRSRYTTENQQFIDKYLAEHATSMREDFQKHVPRGVRCERAFFHVVAKFQRA